MVAMLVVVACCCLALCSAQIMVCYVKQEAARTIYSIFGRPAGAEGQYAWNNKTRHMLAHNTDKLAGLVLRNSIDDLVTSKCINMVNYELLSDKGQFYSTNCTITCIEKIKPKEDKVISRHYIATIVAAVIFVLVVLLVTVARWRNSNATNVEEGDE